MTDLDARVAALLDDVDTYAATRSIEDRYELEQAIRAELQKPALHEPASEAEIEAVLCRYFELAEWPDKSSNIPRKLRMKRALESFLQGRTKPLSDEQWSEAYLKGAAAGEKIAAQEEITDEQIDAIWEELPDCALVTTYSDQRRFARAIIRASKGEKT